MIRFLERIYHGDFAAAGWNTTGSVLTSKLLVWGHNKLLWHTGDRQVLAEQVLYSMCCGGTKESVDGSSRLNSNEVSQKSL